MSRIAFSMNALRLAFPIGCGGEERNQPLRCITSAAH